MKAVKADIFDRVQGVSFRYSAKEKAKLLGIKGWVKNNTDGSVSVHFEGSEKDVEEFKEYLEKGPSLAKVKKTNFSETPLQKFEDFEIRY